MNHKAASGEQNIKLDTTSEESDDEMINMLNRSQKVTYYRPTAEQKWKKKYLKRLSEKFLHYKEISEEKSMAQLSYMRILTVIKISQ